MLKINNTSLKVELSIIILTWNSQEVIENCLDSIYSSNRDLNFEIIVVDNNSRDRTKEILKNSYPKVKLMANVKNLGYAKGNNQGIEKSKGEFILLLNPDVKLIDDFLAKITKFFKEHPEAGALGPQLLNPDKSIQSSCREFPEYSTILWELLSLSHIFPRSKIFGRWRMRYFDHNSLAEVDQPMGSVLLIRRKTLKEVGLFDTNFKMFFNDVDLCYRIKKAGWKIYFYPGAKAFHIKASSTQKAKAKMIFLSHWGFYKFLKKYGTGWANEILSIFLGGLLLLSSGLRILLFYLKNFR